MEEESITKEEENEEEQDPLEETICKEPQDDEEEIVDEPSLNIQPLGLEPQNEKTRSGGEEQKNDAISRFKALMDEVYNTPENGKAEIYLDGDYEFTEALYIVGGRDISFKTKEGKKAVFRHSLANKFNKALIEVGQRGKLVIEGETNDSIVFDGQKVDLENSSYGPLGLKVYGEVEINGATFKDFYNNSTTTHYKAPIDVSGTKTKRAKLVINDVSIRDNEIYGKPDLYNLSRRYYGYGAIRIGQFADVVMNDGEIKNNIASNGTVEVGIQKGPDMTDIPEEYASTFTMNGGIIDNNKALTRGCNGGGVTVQRSSLFEMNGGTISNNTANYGGGVHVNNHFIEVTNNTSYANTQAGEDNETYNKKYPTKFIMNGGVIEGNEALFSGGGIYINSDNVEINRGKILNNTAASRGGGIYISMSPVQFELKNALITKNKAVFRGNAGRWNGHGGGFWGCPTSTFYFNVKDGNVITGNSAEGQGTDIFTTGHTDNYKVNGVDISETFVTVIKAVDRYGKEITLISENGNEDLVTRERATFQLIFDEDSMALAQDLPVLIAGNVAPSGGGVGTNAAFDSGERGKFKIDVRKVWKNEAGKEKKNNQLVRLSLYYEDQLIDVLTIDSNDIHTFTNLVHDPQENIDAYKLIEKHISGYTSEVEVMLKSEYYDDFEGEDGFIFIVTNTETPDEPDNPPETPDEPDEPPETPDEPDNPPETPDEPDNPPETPDEPDNPPETPDEPESPPENPPEEPPTVETPPESSPEEPPTVETPPENLPEAPPQVYDKPVPRTGQEANIALLVGVTLLAVGVYLLISKKISERA